GAPRSAGHLRENGTHPSHTSDRPRTRGTERIADMPDIVVVGLVALVAAIVGFGIALLLRRSFALASETTARANADRLLAEARARQNQILLEAKDEALKSPRTPRPKTPTAEPTPRPTTAGPPT